MKNATAAAGFQETVIRDHAVAMVTAWYQSNGLQTTKYVILCDIGGDTTNYTLLKNRHHGFERVMGCFSSHFNHGGNYIQQSILDAIFRRLQKTKDVEAFQSWMEKKNAFLVKIRGVKEVFFNSGVLNSRINVGKKQIEIREKDLVNSSSLLAERQGDKLKLFIDQCSQNNIDLRDTSLVLTGNGALSPRILENAKKVFLGNVYVVKSNQCNAATDIVYQLSSNPATLVSRNQKVQQFSAFYMAAITGDPIAQYHLGNCYAYGRGTPVVPEESFFWFQRSAEQNNHKAMYQLGKCYQKGWGEFTDFEKAISFFKEAALHRNIKAQHRLGLIFSGRRANFQDFEKAQYWFTMAAKNGHKESAERLKMLEARQVIKITKNDFSVVHSSSKNQ